MERFRVVTVCTMNICRSPAAATLVERALTDRAAGVSVEVSSAGTKADPGAPRCLIAQALIGVEAPGGESRSLTRELVEGADLILTADTAHRGQALSLAPAARSRTFTMVEAARLAAWAVSDEGVIGFARRKARDGSVDAGLDDMRALTDPLPVGRVARLRWLIVEMDAARGVAPVGENRFGYLNLETVGPDDIPDPHVVGLGHHAPSIEALSHSVTAIGAAVGALMSEADMSA